MSNASVAMQLPPPSQATLHAPLPSGSSSLTNVPPNNTHPVYGTRKRQNSSVRTTQRNPENASPPPPASGHPVRRIRPLGPITPSAHSNTANPVLLSGDGAALDKQKDWKKGPGWRATSGVQQLLFDFPPKNVVLHPEDASNKVFIAIGRAFMSVGNCAMTVKDLAELAMKNGLSCQNASAAAQAITFFIRSHLHRCEVEEDFPLLLRHVLSGTPKDDALAPALYSRSGGNISKQQKDENGKDFVDRKTSFRRGTTVWYLSKAAGAPCPFARCGIALRDFSEVSAITGAESRKGSGAGKRNDVDTESSRGLKRKREREGLRRRTTTGMAVTQVADDDDEVEGRKPPKIKLTLRLRPCLTSMREKSEPVESSSSSEFDSDSDSDSDSNDGSMLVEEDAQAEHSAASTQESSRKHVQTTEPSWTFPPYPIHRRISIPPYTPCEESCPTYFTSPSADWSPVKTEPTYMEPSTSDSSYHRASSVAFSVASPPPESDMEDEFGEDDYEEDFSFSFSDTVKSEDEAFAYVWPKAAPSMMYNDEVVVKTEPDYDYGVGTSKRNSTQTLTGIKTEDLPYELQALSLSFDAGTNTSDSLLRSGFDFKVEESIVDNGVPVWDPPADITPVGENDAELMLAWKNIELFGPESLNLQELELCEMDDAVVSHSPSPKVTPEVNYVGYAPEVDNVDLSACHSSFLESKPYPLSPSILPTSLDNIVPSWSAGSLSSLSSGSPDTDLESLAPASPSPHYGPESPTIVRDNSIEENHLFPSFINDGTLGGKEVIDKSAPWTIPGSSGTRGMPSPQRHRPTVGDISVSEASTPWERGMVSQDDVEERLLPLLSPLQDDNTGRMPSLSQPAAEYSNSPPLSPQEAEMFQTFCLIADNEPESIEAKDGQSQLPEVFAASLFAASSRPKIPRSTSSKRTTKFDSRRMSLEKAEAEVSDYPADDDASAEANSKKKNAILPLRRSKRVATQSAREKLRKRA